MQTQTQASSLRLLPPPVVVPGRLLLTQSSSATRRAETSNLAPALLSVRATQVTVVLSEILEERCYFVGALNDD